MTRAERIWIIGASSGIGEALAHAYAAQGASLILSARRKAELSSLNVALGGGHAILPLDVSSAEAMRAAAHAVFQRGAVDRILFMAATYTPTPTDAMTEATTSHIIDVNLKGAFHTVIAALPFLLKQKRGQLALCGSVAGYRGLPNSQPYAATKAAIINLAESLRAEHGSTLDIRVINPGFVETPMTAKNSFHMPMMVSPQEAAQAIVDGLKGSAFEVHFPKRFTRLMKLLRWLPDPLYFIAARKMK